MAENEKKPEEQADSATEAESKEEKIEVEPEEAEVVEEEAVEAEAEEVVEAEAEEAEEEVEEEIPVKVEEPEEKKVPAVVKLSNLTDGMVRSDLPDFRPGDTVKVHVKIIEGTKERVQVFEGVVIAIKHHGIDKTFTVRKTSWGVGVERSFFYNSPKVAKVIVTRRGRVRRAKLYYLRERAGKSARIKEGRTNK